MSNSMRLSFCLLASSLLFKTVLTTDLRDSHLVNTEYGLKNDIRTGTNVAVRKENDPVQLGIRFMLSQRNSVSYGWDQETHRALITLALAGALHPEDTQDLEQQLMAKELELRLALFMSSNPQEEYSAGRLALYIDGLIAICHNPRNFYGTNLVDKLKPMGEMDLSYSYSLQSLALCNAGESYDQARLQRLSDYLKEDPSQHGNFPDNLAMAVLAAACGSKVAPMATVDENVNSAVRNLKKLQKSDGSFGNIYSSGLVNQAMIYTETDDQGWNRSRALEYIQSQQKNDGSFVDFMGTYFALPVLVNRTLGSLANWTCSESNPTLEGKEKEIVSSRLLDETVTGSPNETVEELIQVNLTVRVPGQPSYSVVLIGQENGNLYTILQSNADKIRIEYKVYSYGHMIVSVDGVSQDPSTKKYWIIYVVDRNGTEHWATTGVDGLYPEDKDGYAFELQTITSK